MPFKIRFKRTSQWFWCTRTITGFRLDKSLDRMSLYFANGAIEELATWSGFDCQLGIDWVAATKKQMEKEAGQAIPLAVASS